MTMIFLFILSSSSALCFTISSFNKNLFFSLVFWFDQFGCLLLFFKCLVISAGCSFDWLIPCPRRSFSQFYPEFCRQTRYFFLFFHIFLFFSFLFLTNANKLKFRIFFFRQINERVSTRRQRKDQMSLLIFNLRETEFLIKDFLWINQCVCYDARRIMKINIELSRDLFVINKSVQSSRWLILTRRENVSNSDRQALRSDLIWHWF